MVWSMAQCSPRSRFRDGIWIVACLMESRLGIPSVDGSGIRSWGKSWAAKTPRTTGAFPHGNSEGKMTRWNCPTLDWYDWAFIPLRSLLCPSPLPPSLTSVCHWIWPSPGKAMTLGKGTLWSEGDYQRDSQQNPVYQHNSCSWGASPTQG